MGLVNSRDDTERYRLGYPGLEDNPHLTANLKFHQNKIKSVPDGDYIDTIHKEWYGNYHLLEQHHAYIQWIFPIREEGVNCLAQVLQLHEAKAIRADKKCLARVQRSYEMMLDFYGIKLADRTTGQLERAEYYASRFKHLNSSFHNYLRITRILKSLGELGFEHYKLPFLKFILREIFETQLLNNCKESCVRFWAQTLRNDSERAEIESTIKGYLGVDELSDDEQDIDDDIAEKWLGSDDSDEDKYMGVDDISDDEQDIDDDIAEKWLGSDSDDEDNSKKESRVVSDDKETNNENDEEDNELKQVLEDLISADDDDDLVASGEVSGIKESVEIRVTKSSGINVKESGETTSTLNDTQASQNERSENNGTHSM